jgi:Coenzyme PQQ synthesis protein D (PqqD)
MKANPQRAEGIELEQAAEGFMAHQPEHGRVHYLNHTAAIIFELCDGQTTEEAIAHTLQELYELGDPPLAEVRTCLESLRAGQLVS